MRLMPAACSSFQVRVNAHWVYGLGIQLESVLKKGSRFRVLVFRFRA